MVKPPYINPPLNNNLLYMIITTERKIMFYSVCIKPIQCCIPWPK